MDDLMAERRTGKIRMLTVCVYVCQCVCLFSFSFFVIVPPALLFLGNCLICSPGVLRSPSADDAVQDGKHNHTIWGRWPGFSLFTLFELLFRFFWPPQTAGNVSSECSCLLLYSKSIVLFKRLLLLSFLCGTKGSKIFVFYFLLLLFVSSVFCCYCRTFGQLLLLGGCVDVAP